MSFQLVQLVRVNTSPQMVVLQPTSQHRLLVAWLFPSLVLGSFKSI